MLRVVLMMIVCRHYYLVFSNITQSQAELSTEVTNDISYKVSQIIVKTCVVCFGLTNLYMLWISSGWFMSAVITVWSLWLIPIGCFTMIVHE